MHINGKFEQKEWDKNAQKCERQSLFINEFLHAYTCMCVRMNVFTHILYINGCAYECMNI